MVKCNCGNTAQFTGMMKTKGEYEIYCSECKEGSWILKEDLSPAGLKEVKKIFPNRSTTLSSKSSNIFSKSKQKPLLKKPVLKEIHPTPKPQEKTDPFQAEYLRNVKRVFERSIPQKKKNFTKRPAQIELAEKIAQTIYDGGILLSEAGVGTGKTFAYTVPALLDKSLVYNGGPIVLSTKTISLQEQLAEDVKELSKILEVKTDCLVCKGQGNYVCMSKLTDPRIETNHFEELMEWAEKSQFGDLAEVQNLLTPKEMRAIGVQDCIPSNCVYADNCPYLKYKRVRSNFNDGVIICNHNLLIANMKMRETSRKLWPTPAVIIIDEAHGLEEACRQILGANLAMKEFDHILKQVRKARVKTDSLYGADKRVSNAFSRLHDLAINAHSSNTQCNEENNRFVIPIDIAFIKLCVKLRIALNEFQEILDSAVGFSQSKYGGAVSHADKILNGVDNKLDLLIGCLSEFLDDPDNHYAHGEFINGETHVFVGPIEVDRFLHKSLWKHSMQIPVILTSGTLTERGNFEHVRKRLGLDGNKSSFAAEYKGIAQLDMSGKVGLYIAKDLPAPVTPNEGQEDIFTSAMAKRVGELLTYSGGRSLVLFTSFQRMHKTYEYLRSMDFKFKILKQGDAAAEILLERFRNDESSVLLATGSFWEGVDVVGRALSLLIMDKLPFPSQGEPLTQARIQHAKRQKRDPWQEILLPEMLLRLRQGAGRLIRSESDSGVISILDSRAATSIILKLPLHGVPSEKCGFTMLRKFPY